MQAQYQKEFMKSTNSFFLRLAQYGVIVEEAKMLERTVTSSGIAFFISVPRESELKLEDGSEAAGENLAKYVKQLAYDNHHEFLYGVDNGKFKPFESILEYKVIVKYRDRDEVWTKQKEESNTMDMKARLAVMYQIQNERGEN